ATPFPSYLKEDLPHRKTCFGRGATMVAPKCTWTRPFFALDAPKFYLPFTWSRPRELWSRPQDLAATNVDLVATSSALAATKDDLVATSSALAATKDDLVVPKSTLVASMYLVVTSNEGGRIGHDQSRIGRVQYSHGRDQIRNGHVQYSLGTTIADVVAAIADFTWALLPPHAIIYVNTPQVRHPRHN
ncbi:hypothetical protein H0H92_011477, partial [Tricholoma furcatifolium]